MNQNIARRNAVAWYHSVDVEGDVFAASPHRLIQLLMEGVISKLSVAINSMASSPRSTEDTQRIGECVSGAMDIIGELQANLNIEAAVELTADLDSLYTYMTMRLVEAHGQHDAGGLVEVRELMRELKLGWDAIDPTPSSLANVG
ncbi:MAG: flagellar export chaperone FliS [Gammaproteobacteria bacterium]|nr:flagellar export chaperone FliS [Gammaproteobacteria bacterium]